MKIRKGKINEGIFELNLKLSQKAVKELRELQQLVGANSITEVFINAVTMYKFIKETQAQGAQIIIHQNGQNDRVFINAK